MPNYATRISGGDVFSGGELAPADILVDEGRIVALLAPGEVGEAENTIDARGMAVLPGIIDTHAHTRDPGYPQKEDFLTASQAAAVGGITTMIDMPNVEPPTDTVEEFEKKRDVADSKSIIDWGHWVAGTKPGEITRLAEAGATGYKIFQVSGAYPHDPRLALNDDGKLLTVMEEIADVGLPCLVHPFNQSLFDALSERAFAAGKPRNWRTFSEVYTTEEVWHTAVNTLINLQALSGVRLQVLHTHSRKSLQLIRAAKERGQRVAASVDPKYYQLTPDELDRLGPRICPAGFVTADDERMAAIYEALEDGTLDIIDSDHAPHTLDEISVQDHDAWNAAMGSPQYDWLYSIVLTDVANGKLSLRRAVELLTEAPARQVGIYPQKGVLFPGSDADLVLVDLERERELTDEGLFTKVGWTPYLGRKIKGEVTLTMLRGEVIALDRQVIGSPGYGRYIPGRSQ